MHVNINTALAVLRPPQQVAGKEKKMAERKITGVGICFGEHEDAQGYDRCNKCDSKTMLVLAFGDWKVDQEPFKSCELSEDIPDEVFVGEVSGHWCPACGMLVSFYYNFK